MTFTWRNLEKNDQQIVLAPANNKIFELESINKSHAQMQNNFISNQSDIKILKFLNTNHQINEIILEPQILIQGNQGIFNCKEHLPKILIKVSSQNKANNSDNTNNSFQDRISFFVISKQQKTYFYQEVKECCIKTIGQEKIIIFQNLRINLKNKTYQFKKLNFFVLLTRISQNQEVVLQAFVSDNIRFYHHKFIHIITKQEMKQFLQIFSQAQKNYQNQASSQQLQLFSNIEENISSQIIYEIIQKIIIQIDSEDIDNQFFLNIQGQPKIYIVIQNSDIWLVNKRLKGIIGFVKNYDKIPKKYKQLQIFPQKLQNIQNISQLFHKKKNKQSLDDKKFPNNLSEQSQIQQKKRNQFKNKNSKSQKKNLRQNLIQPRNLQKSQNITKQQFDILLPTKKIKQQNQTQKTDNLIQDNNKMKQQPFKDLIMNPIQAIPMMKQNEISNDPFQFHKIFPFTTDSIYGNKTEQPKINKSQAQNIPFEEKILNRSEYINKNQSNVNQHKIPINMTGGFPMNQPFNIPYLINSNGMFFNQYFQNNNENIRQFFGDNSKTQKKSNEDLNSQNRLPNFMYGNMYNPYMFAYHQMMYKLHLMMNSSFPYSPFICQINPQMANFFPSFNPYMVNPPSPIFNNPMSSNFEMMNNNKDVKKFRNCFEEIKLEEKKNSEKRLQKKMKFKQSLNYKKSSDLKKKKMKISDAQKLPKQFKLGTSRRKLPECFNLNENKTQIKQKQQI